MARSKGTRMPKEMRDKGFCEIPYDGPVPPRHVWERAGVSVASIEANGSVKTRPFNFCVNCGVTEIC